MKVWPQREDQRIWIGITAFAHSAQNDPNPLLTVLTDAEADVRATAALLDRILERMGAGTDN